MCIGKRLFQREHAAGESAIREACGALSDDYRQITERKLIPIPHPSPRYSIGNEHYSLCTLRIDQRTT